VVSKSYLHNGDVDATSRGAEVDSGSGADAEMTPLRPGSSKDKSSKDDSKGLQDAGERSAGRNPKRAAFFLRLVDIGIDESCEPERRRLIQEATELIKIFQRDGS